MPYSNSHYKKYNAPFRIKPEEGLTLSSMVSRNHIPSDLALSVGVILRPVSMWELVTNGMACFLVCVYRRDKPSFCLSLRTRLGVSLVYMCISLPV